ncbi:hypothetical protein FRC11_012837 [Ceratobasidium sp. 423]|nr:hypothetical protein FRC11_012837 [Ceratobasidium sp. 423]
MPIPSRENTPVPPPRGPCRTQSLSSLLGDRDPHISRKRAMRSPSPTLGDEVTVRTECLHELWAQLDREAAKLEQLTSIVNPGLAPNVALSSRDPLGPGSASMPGPSPHNASPVDPDNDIIPGFQASGVVLVILESVVRNMHGGWKTPFSLALLQDNYCIAAFSQAHKGKTILFGNEGDQVTLAASTESIDTSMPEDCLTYEQWVQAWWRLLQLIRQYLSEALHACWTTHYQFIDTQPDCTKQWKLWLCYDIAVQVATHADKCIDPSSFQSQIYFDLVPQATVDAAEALITSRLPLIQSTLGVSKPSPHLAKSSSMPSMHQPQGSSISGHKPQGVMSSFSGHLGKGRTGSCMASVSATSTMELGGPALPPPAKMAHMLAHSVDLTSMVPNPASSDPRKVVTPLIPGTWEKTLCQCNLWN